MTSPTTRRATDGSQAGGQSRGLPQRIDQSQLAKDVKQAGWFVGGFVLVGFLLALLFTQLMGGIG